MGMGCRITEIWVSLDFYELCLQPSGSLSLSGPSANYWALGINKDNKEIGMGLREEEGHRRISGWSRVHHNGEPGTLSRGEVVTFLRIPRKEGALLPP